ncbi:MAG: glycogen synthase [Acidimicrobiia bacterium]|nr:glycogen synthase [Acidimicrobiia bacterium]MDH5292270.1 glycogen synthase [Acidimicrobiia bacterium]
MKTPLRVLFVASEVVPYAKTGGLADVGGALPAALRAAGHDVVTILPLYSAIDRSGLRPVPEWSGTCQVGSHGFDWLLWQDPATNTRFVEVPALFDRHEFYTHDPDEHIRFAVFSKICLDHVVATGWIPNIIHCNDWQTGLMPAMLRGPYSSALAGTRSILTIHNLGYQGVFGAQSADELGLEGHTHLLHREHLAEGRISLLETAIMHADAITTVSPTYAREIQTPEGGAGLDALLRERPVTGILNGIDDEEWNPRTDTLIPWRYSEKSLWRKERDKEALLTRMDLPYRKHVPVMGMVTRLTIQKGIDIVRSPLIHFLESWDVRLCVVGSGERDYADFFRWLAASYPDKVAFFEGYSNELSHLVEAGADIFLMPSLYEPCGLNQMYSLAYGTIPVVRRVGGLADTVDQADPETGTGTGVVFDHFTEDGLGWAIGRALTLHLDRKGWQLLQKNGMAVDNSWDQRAAEYEELYRTLI